MVSLNIVRKIILEFPETSEEPHFEKISFRVRKKIFATYDEKAKRVCIKLSLADQDVFSSGDKMVIFPVPNKWGKQGWTLIDLKKITRALLKEALASAYCQVAPIKLSSSLRED